MTSKDTKTHRHSSGQIGPYKRRYTLGRGGFGKVSLGEHIHLHTKVAVKVLHAHLVNEMAERFKHEAQLVAQLAQHPHVVRVLDYNIENGRPYIIMDYAPGGNLRQRYTFGEQVPLRAVVSYVTQIASGLQHAHDAGIVHCDVKPENMFVGSKREILIGDFGIAVGLQEENPQSEDTFGTTPYMAPEQILGQPQPESDQYALAVVVYEWLTGQQPFTGDDKEEIALKHLFEQPRPLRALDPAIPVAVEQVVMKALAKDPQQRYSSVTAFAQALADASRPRSAAPMQRVPTGGQSSMRQSPLPSHSPLPPRRRALHPISLLLAALVVLVLLTLVFIYMLFPVATVIITETGLLQTKDYSVSSMIGNRDIRQNPVSAHIETITTVAQKNKVAATGTQHVQATQAHGEVTFYNWDSVPHDVPAGTIIAVPNSTLQVETDEAVKVPVGELPEAGVASARAHIVQTGTDGNIAAGTLYRTACCASDAIRVNNLNAFSGGQDDHVDIIVQQSDIDDAAKSLEALQAQIGLTLLQNLATRHNLLVIPSVQCIPTVNPDANVGSRAATVTVTIVTTCKGVFYDDEAVTAVVQPQFVAYEDQRLGDAYSLTGNIKIKVTQANVLPAPTSLVLHVVTTGVWHFNFDEVQKQRLLLAIAGKGRSEARAQLVQLISKQGVDTITVQFTWNIPGFTDNTLPSDIHRINLEIVQK